MLRRILACALALAIAAPAHAGSLAGASLANPVPAPPPKVAPHLWQSLIPFWGVQDSSQAGGSAFTFGEDFSVEGSFTAVELIFQNSGTAAITLGAAAVAASATLADPVVPRDGNGNVQGWVAVTCGGTTCTLAPSASATRRQITVSDPIPLASIAPTDGSFPHIFTRVLSPTSGGYHVPLMAMSNLNDYTTRAGGRAVAAYYNAGDNVSTAANLAALTSSNTSLDFQFVVGVRYLSPQRVVTVMGCGDSLTAGYQTTSGYNGFGLQASVALSRQLGIGVSYVAHGFPGTVTSDFIADCQQAVTALQPAVVTVPIDSPNDYLALGGSPTTAQLAASEIQQAQRELAFADTAMQAGTLPVMLTPIPFGTRDAAANGGVQRQAAGALVRAMSARGAVMLDAQAIISGYVPTVSTLQTLPAACLAPDNQHLNDTCQGAIGAAATSLLAPRL